MKMKSQSKIVMHPGKWIILLTSRFQKMENGLGDWQ